MDISIDLNILAEPAAQYHAKADRYLSSHQLLDFIRCPWLHRKKAVGLIEDSDSASYLIGRAAHTLILEGRDAFEAAFARRPSPSGPRSRASRSCPTIRSIWSSRCGPASR